MQNYKNYFELDTPSFGGMNNATQFSLIPRSQSPRLENAYMDQLGDISKRPGSVPVIETAIDPISHLMIYPFPQTVSVGAKPTLSAVSDTGSTLPAATYYVRYSYVTEDGETNASPEESKAIASGEKLRVVIPAFPLHVLSANIYISTSTNTEKLERNVTALSSDFSEPLDGTGSTYPTNNTTTLRNDIMAVSDDTIYSYYGDELHAITMTDTLNSPDVFDADFTGMDNSGNLVNVKLIADGGVLKQVINGVCQDVSPASDDTSPLPANVLSDINAIGVKHVWTHSNYVFLSTGDNRLWYSKQATQGGNGVQYNYFPETNFTILVRKGDYINGCGIPFDDVCFIPMRQGWNVNTGTNFNDFDFGGYLNTINGVIAPRSPQIITYADGSQTIAFLSDDGVHEIFTTILDSRGKQYATRGIMKDKIDFNSYGFTESEKAAAVSNYIVSLNMYLVEISRGTTNYVFGYETRSREWYVWKGLQINSLIEKEGVCYFAGNDGLLKKFDKDLYSDWGDMGKTTGKPVHFKRYSPAVAGEFSGFPSMWDAYLVESKQWLVPTTLDITFIFANETDVMANIIRNEVFIEGVSQWGYAKYVNTKFTDLLNEPNEIIFDYSRLSKYVQVLWENDRDEPVKIFKEKWKGRSSGQ